MKPESIAQRIAANPLAAGAANQRPVYCVVTNCTYDGMCYDSKGAEAYRRLADEFRSRRGAGGGVSVAGTYAGATV